MNFILFILNLVFFGFVSILILSVGVVACTAPLGLFAKSEKPSKFLTLPFLGVAAIYQIYFWGLWSAFCVATIISFAERPEVTWDWCYWITGFFYCIAPIGWLSQKEQQTSQSLTDLRGIQAGTTIYSIVAIAAFIVFAFAPSLMLPPYSWALKPLGLATEARFSSVDEGSTKEHVDQLEPAVSAQDVTCADYSDFAENQKDSLAYGYLEGVQAAIDKDVADILVPPADARHVMWWVLPAGLGKKPAKQLAEKLVSHCRSPGNRREGLLAAILSMSYQKDGWPALGISTDKQKTDPWKSFPGGKDSSVSCSTYTATREETRQAFIYGYYLGTVALNVRLNSSVNIGIVWPSDMSAQAVRV